MIVPCNDNCLVVFCQNGVKCVNTDLKILKDLDLVSLRKSQQGRAKVKPEVSFDKLNIEITLT